MPVAANSETPLEEAAKRYVGTVYGRLPDNAMRRSLIDTFFAGAYAATSCPDDAVEHAVQAEIAAWREIMRMRFATQRDRK